jgi:predicted transcriptional regulator
MKAISIKEPYATLILQGKKTIETRTWTTKYRGDILLCASANPKSKISGYAFVIAELYDIKPMTIDHEKQACCEVYDKAQSWFLRHIRKIPPTKVKGKLGLFTFELYGV